MKVVSYLACLPPNNKNQEKGEILSRYAAGVNRIAGDTAILHPTMNLIDADVAMMIGWAHEDGKDVPHINFRRQIVEHQKRMGKRLLLADSNLFLYKDKTNPWHYLRYSFDGVFPNTGTYCDTNIDPMRWQKLAKNSGLQLHDYRTKGNHILLCLQRNGGWSMGDYNVVDWTASTIKEIRKYSDREIVIRAHPGDRSSRNYLSPANLMQKINMADNIRLSREGADLTDDLKRCWAVVNHNSSPAVGAAIEGYPVFVTDPIKSQCGEIASTDLATIENPYLPDRQKWVERLAMFHWNFEEIQNGECWHHMRNYV